MPFEEKLKIGESLTSLETYQVIQYLINQSRIANNVYDDDKMKCEKCSYFIRDKLRGLGDVINVNGLGLPNEFAHYFSVVSFNTEKGMRSFVIDPVFDQFNTNVYSISGTNYDIQGAFQDKIFFTRLVEQKYFELTESNLNKYISGFSEICRIANLEVDKEEVTNKTNKSINPRFYTFSNENDKLINDKEILIQLRKRLTEILKQNIQPGDGDTIKTR